MEPTEQPAFGSDEAMRLRRRARDEKREKQRLASVDRAAKMHVARLQSQTAGDAEHSVLTRRPYHVGCSGWFYWHWRGIFYPEEIPRADWFSHYAATFDTVELNAPFYSWPTVATVKTWVR